MKVGGDQSQAEWAAEESTSIATSAAKAGLVITSQAPTQEETREEKSVDANVENEAVQIPPTQTKEGDLAAAEAAGSPPEARTPVVEVEIASIENNSVSMTAGEEAAVQAPPAAAEEDVLAKLAMIGFEDPILNAELLEKNSFDFWKTLDDLYAVEEWDTIFGELQEMGFYDTNLNRRLMLKNKGSVKWVVKDLVQMERGD